MTITVEEFEDTKETVSADARGRVTLGSELKDELFTISRNVLGQILLTPVTAVPKHERWLWQNPAALSAVRQGLEEAKSGLGKAVDYSQYADIGLSANE